MIDGVEYWVSAWVKESKAGNKFFSLSFKPKNEARRDPPPQQHRSRSSEPPRDHQAPLDDFDDSVPF